VPRTVYPCQEFTPVEVPLSDLLEDGRITIYPEAEKFFDLDWRAGRLVVAPKSYVGLIPINGRIAIRVLPRFPIGNLFWILHRASAALRFMTGHLRQYEVIGEEGVDPLELLAKQLTQLCQESLRSGVLRRYLYRTFESGTGGGLNLSQTISRFRSRGIRYLSVWDDAELSASLRENQLLKAAMTRVLAYFSTSPDRELRRLTLAVAEVLFLLDSVPSLQAWERFSEVEVLNMVRRLPSLHRAYGSVLWLSYLIYSRRGISVESSGAAEFDTFVVNLADVFEDYLRVLVSSRIADLVPGGTVKNGNVDEVRLFTHGDPSIVKPDMYIISGGRPVLVLDAKYKVQVKASDRYEVLAFCEALGVGKAVLLLPGDASNPAQLLGVTPRGTELQMLKINLAAANMQAAEDDFIRALAQVL
jgi:5-methylcytosine-specific restriction enzyme subunit McrC